MNNKAVRIKLSEIARALDGIGSRDMTQAEVTIWNIVFWKDKRPYTDQNKRNSVAITDSGIADENTYR